MFFSLVFCLAPCEIQTFLSCSFFSHIQLYYLLIFCSNCCGVFMLISQWILDYIFSGAPLSPLNMDHAFYILQYKSFETTYTRLFTYTLFCITWFTSRSWPCNVDHWNVLLFALYLWWENTTTRNTFRQSLSEVSFLSQENIKRRKYVVHACVP